MGGSMEGMDQWVEQWKEWMNGWITGMNDWVNPSDSSTPSYIHQTHQKNQRYYTNQIDSSTPSSILLFWIQTTNNIRVLLWRSSSPRSTNLLHIHRRDRLLLQQSLRHSLHIRSVRLQHLQRLLHRLRQNPLRREVNLPSRRLTTLKFPRFPYLNGFWKLSPIC